MDQKTVIIIVVASSVGGLIVAFILLRLIIHSCHRKNNTVPIPAPQPLRHHARAAAMLQATAVYSSTDLLQPAVPFGNASRTSVGSNALHSPSEEGTFESGSGSEMTLPTPMDPLEHPQPSFHAATPRSASPNLSDETSGSAQDSSQRRSSLKPRPRHRSSMTSSHYSSRPASLTSMQSRSTLQGVPHGPYSSIQVVLPAPLAAGPSATINRLSMVDSWAPVPRRDDTGPQDNTEPEPGRRSSVSAGQSVQSRAPPRRSSSSSLSPISPTPSPLSMSHVPTQPVPPPVPRTPSMHTSHPLPGKPPVATPLDQRGQPRFS